MTSAAMAFMRDHGVLKDIYSESTGTAHKTAKGTKVSVRTVKAPGFGPKASCAASCHSRSSSKLQDIGGNVLPPYDGSSVKSRWTRRKPRPTAIWRVG